MGCRWGQWHSDSMMRHNSRNRIRKCIEHSWGGSCSNSYHLDSTAGHMCLLILLMSMWLRSQSRTHSRPCRCQGHRDLGTGCIRCWSCTGGNSLSMMDRWWLSLPLGHSTGRRMTCTESLMSMLHNWMDREVWHFVQPTTGWGRWWKSISFLNYINPKTTPDKHANIMKLESNIFYFSKECPSIQLKIWPFPSLNYVW